MVRKSVNADIDDIMKLFSDAKKLLREKGIAQWQEDYPDINTIFTDILNGDSFVLLKEGVVVGTVATTFRPEPAYNQIEPDAWLNTGTYGSIHRIAIAPAYVGQGLAAPLFDFCKKMCQDMGVKSLRSAAHPDNTMMQGALRKNGFQYCGMIEFLNEPRMAYEKLL